jgi:hypothetical protein
MASHSRGNFAHEVFNSLKSIRIRHLILRKLYEAVQSVFNRLYKATNSSGSAAIIDATDVNSSFRLMQLLEFVFVTTSDAPWITVGSFPQVIYCVLINSSC